MGAKEKKSEPVVAEIKPPVTPTIEFKEPSSIVELREPSEKLSTTFYT